MSSNKVAASKKLAFMLRHTKEFIDDFGWAEISTVLALLNITKEQLNDLVATDSKQRYEIEGETIRANQGHSVEVDLSLNKQIPPVFLLHGTSTDAYNTILRAGIKKMSRNHVHLTDTYETAIKTGSRHGEPVVLVVNALQMHYDGYKFYLSKNNVWLTDFVPPQYLDNVKLWIPPDKLSPSIDPTFGL